jgi:hypothetical protein
MIRLYPFLFALALCAALAGCGGSSGPSRQAIRGSVQVGGSEIEKGAISFVPAPGTSGPAAIGTIENGSYRFTKETGPFPGLHKVLIDIDPPTQTSTPATPPGPKGQLVETAAVPPGRRRPVTPPPSKYHFEQEYNVPDDGSSEKDFEL